MEMTKLIDIDDVVNLYMRMDFLVPAHVQIKNESNDDLDAIIAEMIAETSATEKSECCAQSISINENIDIEKEYEELLKSFEIFKNM